MLDFDDEFPHHGGTYANDARLATVTMILLAVMAVIASLMIVYAVGPG